VTRRARQRLIAGDLVAAKSSQPRYKSMPSQCGLKALCLASLHPTQCYQDPDQKIGAAIPGGRCRVFKKRNGLHDLAGLAIAALRNLMFDPGLQNRVPVSISQPLDRDDRLAGDVTDMRLTRTHSGSVYLDGAGAALRDPAAVLGTRDSKFVAQYPKQRHVGNYINLMLDPVDRELDHVDVSLR
jgi:hypothetical protein